MAKPRVRGSLGFGVWAFGFGDGSSHARALVGSFVFRQAAYPWPEDAPVRSFSQIAWRSRSERGVAVGRRVNEALLTQPQKCLCRCMCYLVSMYSVYTVS